MRKLVMLSLLALAAFGSACYPVVVEPGCRQQVNDCLRSCQTSQASRVDEKHVFGPTDTRSACERQCHESCAQHW